jgi:DNA-binding XRE family transcriptional regulator
MMVPFGQNSGGRRNGSFGRGLRRLIFSAYTDMYRSQWAMRQAVNITMSDNANILGRQIAASRALLRMEQTDLAKAANISVPTLRRMEASEGPAVGMANNVAAVRAALEAAGVDFIPENGGGAGVRLKKTL